MRHGEEGARLPDYRESFVGENEGGRFEPALYASRRRGARAERPVPAQGLHATVKGIEDIGFLVAFANRNDAHYEWAVQLAGKLNGAASARKLQPSTNASAGLNDVTCMIA